MNEPPKQRWGCMQWGVVIGVVLFLITMIIPASPKIAKMGNQVRAVNNCRQIIITLKLYARDNGSAYPDSGPARAGTSSANQVFHRLFEEGIVTEEHVFGCPNSVYVPDGKLGAAPDFAKALEPGECHWMLMKGQTNASRGDMPVVVENALDASWPPKWDVSDQGGTKRGRVWKGNKIIIGRNDGSVSVEKLSLNGTIDWRRMFDPGYGNKSWIDSLSPEQIAKLSYWDVEDK